MAAMNEKLPSNKEAVIQVVNAIPVGTVATYGQVAQLAGLGQAARYVGTTMKNLPHNSRLPWHRVVNAQGKISFPVDSEGYKVQKQRLLKEGVQFNGQRISLAVFGWSTVFDQRPVFNQGAARD